MALRRSAAVKWIHANVVRRPGLILIGIYIYIGIIGYGTVISQHGELELMLITIQHYWVMARQQVLALHIAPFLSTLALP